MIVCQLLHEDVDERNAGKTPCSRYDNYIYGFLEITYYTGVAAPSRVLVQSHRGRAKIKVESRSGRMFASPLCLG